MTDWTAQRRNALTAANRIRTDRADAFRFLRCLAVPDALRLAADWLEEPPAELESMTVGAFLLRLPTVGAFARGKLLSASAVSASKRLGEISVRGRGELARRLRSRANTTRRSG